MKRWVILALIIGAWFYLALAQSVPEELAITTYYPSPYGSYNELTWGCQNEGRSAARLVADEGGSIILGGHRCSGANNVRGNPYIQFKNRPDNIVWAQIQSDANNLWINGTNPNAFRTRIDGSLYVNGFVEVRPNGEFRGKLGRGSCYYLWVSNPQYSNYYRSRSCLDGDYQAGMRVEYVRDNGGDWDLYGFDIYCCKLQ